MQTYYSIMSSSVLGCPTLLRLHFPTKKLFKNGIETMVFKPYNTDREGIRAFTNGLDLLFY